MKRIFASATITSFSHTAISRDAPFVRGETNGGVCTENLVGRVVLGEHTLCVEQVHVVVPNLLMRPISLSVSVRETAVLEERCTVSSVPRRYESPCP